MKNNEQTLKSIFYGLIGLGIAIGYASVYSGANINAKYYWGLAVTAVIGILALKAYQKLNDVRKMDMLRKRWGKEEERKRNYSSIQALFNILSKDNGKYTIDDQTYRDLNLDHIFNTIDRTLTTPGEQMLYNILRTPLFEDEALYKRNSIIKLFQKNKELREMVQMEFLRVGKQREGLGISLLWGDFPEKSPLRPLVYIMPVLTALSFGSIGIIKSSGIFLIIIFFMASLFLHYKMREKIGDQLASVKYIDLLIRTAYHLGHRNDRILDEYGDVLKTASEACSKILKKTGMLTLDSLGEINDYINIIFLVQERSFFGAMGEILKCRSELQKIYMTIGEIDALLSVASYRTGLESYVEPDLSNSGAFIKGENLKHPLIKDAVPNSIFINGEGIIITGSNMSGKSTFLRTLAINALFAQTIYTCLASSYSGSYFNIVTSISQSDNIIGGKSYYLAEAEALLRIVKASDGKLPLLAIIDEIFRGTNSIERIAASVEILDYLVEHNSLAVVATHDIEITDMVGDRYRCFYFTENIGEEGLDFDYHINEGVSLKRNAVKLMKYLGYPEDIVSRTTERVKSIIPDNDEQKAI